jgi:hypothetical protein
MEARGPGAGAPDRGVNERTWWNVAESARRIRAALVPEGMRAALARVAYAAGMAVDV